MSLCVGEFINSRDDYIPDSKMSLCVGEFIKPRDDYIPDPNGSKKTTNTANKVWICLFPVGVMCIFFLLSRKSCRLEPSSSSVTCFKKPTHCV